MKTIQVPALLDGMSPLKDGGMSIRFHTQEMTPEMMLAAYDYYQKFGWMLFKASEIAFTDEEIPKVDPDDDTKTPGQRLRSVIFVLYTQQGGKPEDFQTFYRQYMEKLIESVKSKLEQP